MVKTKRIKHRKLKKRIKSRKRHKSRKQHKLKKRRKSRKHLKTRRRRKLKYRGGSLWYSSSKKNVERKAKEMRQKANKIHQKLAVPYKDAEGNNTSKLRRIPQKRQDEDDAEKISKFFEKSAPKMKESFFRNPFRSNPPLPPSLEDKMRVGGLTLEEEKERLKKIRALREKNETKMKKFKDMDSI